MCSKYYCCALYVTNWLHLLKVGCGGGDYHQSLNSDKIFMRTVSVNPLFIQTNKYFSVNSKEKFTGDLNARTAGN